jgi:hypothetical protein
MKKILVILLLLAVMGMSAQPVPTFFPRKFLMEHFTSENCNECPEGMIAIKDFLALQSTPYIWVSHHAVYGTDEYTIPEGNKIAQTFSIYSVPTVMLNRTNQPDNIAIGTSRLENLNVIGDTLAEASVVINHTFNAATRKLDITVSGQVANTEVEQYLLSILIKENRLVGLQADSYSSYKYATWQEYMHSRVVRDFVTATFGDTIEVTNQTYTYSTSYTVNSEWVAENCCIVAYLTPLDKQPVINAEQVPLAAGTEGGEQYEPYGITEGKGPNASITFDSVHIKSVSSNMLEIRMLSHKTMSSYAGICKPVGYIYVNTIDSVLKPGSYPIQDDHSLGSITAGYRIDEEETFGGSRLVYALSEELKSGNIVPIHTWRMNTGEMILDEAGNISLLFTTYNGTTVTATALYDFSVVSGVEGTFAPSPIIHCQKVLRNGQLLIHKQGQWYNVLGYKVSE